MIDAYDLSKRLFDCWRQLSMPNPDAGQLNKKWNDVPVYVNGKIVKEVKIENNKITLVTDNE